MKFSRRAGRTSSVAAVPPAEATSPAPIAVSGSPEWSAVLRATADSNRAGSARTALGGYVPPSDRNHPSKWSPERREELAIADAEVAATAEALRLAVIAHEAVKRGQLPTL
jgi:hypothetical protein